MQAKIQLAFLIAVLQLVSAAPQPRLGFSSESREPISTTERTSPVTTEHNSPAPIPGSSTTHNSPAPIPGSTTSHDPSVLAPGTNNPPPPVTPATASHCKRSWLGKRAPGCGDDGTPAATPAQPPPGSKRPDPPSANPSLENIKPPPKSQKPNSPSSSPPGSQPASPQPGSTEYRNAQIDKLPNVPSTLPNIPKNEGAQAAPGMNQDTHQWVGGTNMYKVPKNGPGDTTPHTAEDHDALATNHAQNIADSQVHKDMGTNKPNAAGSVFYSTPDHPTCKGVMCTASNVRKTGDKPPQQDQSTSTMNQNLPAGKDHAQNMNEQQGIHAETHGIDNVENYLGHDPSKPWPDGSMSSSHHIGDSNNVVPQPGCKGGSQDCEDKLNNKNIQDIYKGIAAPATQKKNPNDPSKQKQLTDPALPDLSTVPGPNVGGSPAAPSPQRRSVVARNIVLRRALHNFIAEQNAKRDLLESRGFYAVEADSLYARGMGAMMVESY